MKILFAMLATVMLAGCGDLGLGTSATKDCTEYATESVCANKNHCAWGEAGCVAK